MVLFNPGLDRRLSLFNTELPTLTGSTVYIRCFQVRFNLDRLKEDEDVLRQEAYSSHIMFG